MKAERHSLFLPSYWCVEFMSHGHIFPHILQFNWPVEGRTGVDQRREFVRWPRCFLVRHLRRHWRPQSQPNHLWHDLASRVQLQGSILRCGWPADQPACKLGWCLRELRCCSVSALVITFSRARAVVANLFCVVWPHPSWLLLSVCVKSWLILLPVITRWHLTVHQTNWLSDYQANGLTD